MKRAERTSKTSLSEILQLQGKNMDCFADNDAAYNVNNGISVSFCLKDSRCHTGSTQKTNHRSSLLLESVYLVYLMERDFTCFLSNRFCCSVERGLTY
jgi:hypothetical protein